MDYEWKGRSSVARAMIVLVLMAVGGTTAMATARVQQGAPSVELVIAADVEDRQPMGASETFPENQEFVVAWTRVNGLEGTTVEHVWKHGDSEIVVPLEIGGPSWRTWSRKTIPEGWTGEWTVEIQDEQGSVLAMATFTIE